MRLRPSRHHCPAPPCTSNHISARSHWGSGMWKCLGLRRAAWASLPEQYSPCTAVSRRDMLCHVPVDRRKPGWDVSWRCPGYPRSAQERGHFIRRAAGEDHCPGHSSPAWNSPKHLPRSVTGSQTPQTLQRHQAFLLCTRPARPWGGINKPLALFWERGRNVRGRLLQ